MPTGLALTRVGVRIGSTDILQGLSLRLLPGELIGLIGPSGAGKSTLIKVLLGLKRPQTGEVELADGIVGYVPQDDALHLTLTVRQALDFTAELRLSHLGTAERTAQIEHVLRQTDLHERLDVRIKRLSGGQRKRVSVALELLTQPPVLILDEPTSGLDPGLEGRMMALFKELAQTGRAVLVSTHAMQSLRLCDRLMVMVQGRLVFLGAPEQALEWFEVKTFAGIFEVLPKHAPLVWQKKWGQA